MVRIIGLMLLVLMSACQAASAPDKASLTPLYVSEVASYPIRDERLIRTVMYAASVGDEALPYLEVNLLDRPQRTKVIDTLFVNEVEAELFGKRMSLVFDEAQGVNVGPFRVNNNRLIFQLEYFSSTPPTFFVTLECVISAESDDLSAPHCQRIDDK